MGEYEIRSIKLTSGEEVIAKVTIDSDGTWNLTDPRILIAAQGGFAFAPVLFSANKDGAFKLNDKAVSFYSSNVHDAFKQEYLEKISGLSIPAPAPQKKIILG